MNPCTPLTPESVKRRAYLSGPKSRKATRKVTLNKAVPTLADLLPLYERHAKLERILAATVSAALLKFRTQKLRMPRREAEAHWNVNKHTLAHWESGESIPPKRAIEALVQWARAQGFADEDT